MNEQEAEVLEDLFADIKIEQEAICLALHQKDIPRETIDSLRSEVDEKAIRRRIRERLLPALFS